MAEFHIDDGAQRWFMEHNQGWQETRKWIGSHGRTGLYAKFWFWVLKHLIEWKDGKPVMQGRRLLYEGNCASYTIKQLEANSGAVPAIAYAINRLVGEAGKPKVAFLDGKIYLTTQAVIQDAVENSQTRPWDAREALESLLDQDQPEERLTIRGHQARWRVMDAKKILGIIELHAIPHKVFDGVRT